MKISQDQKEANRKAIIRAAVEMIGEADVQGASMRSIAQKAGMGDATIYNYFPTKEAILFGYYHDHMVNLIEALKAIPDFHRFNLQEQLQTLFDTSLGLYTPDREFVSKSFRAVLLSGSRDWKQTKPIRTLFLSAVNDMLAAAVEVEEIPEPVFTDLIGQFYMDAYIATIVYWLADRSEGFQNTDVLIDQGLNLSCAMLKAGIANKIFDIAVFFFKNHVLNKLDYLVEPLQKAHQVKRAFMERMDDD